jgi:hypothetical protein
VEQTPRAPGCGDARRTAYARRVPTARTEDEACLGVVSAVGEFKKKEGKERQILAEPWWV